MGLRLQDACDQPRLILSDRTNELPAWTGLAGMVVNRVSLVLHNPREIEAMR